VGTLLRSCAEVHESIKLLFGEVSGVSRGMGVLDGVHVPQEKGLFWDFSSPWFEWAGLHIFHTCIRFVHQKLIVFPYAQYIVGICISLAFQRYSQVRDRCWDL